MRGHAALYIGGMGSAKTNFYHRTATEMGYGARPTRCRTGSWPVTTPGPAAAVPYEFIDRTSLLGNAGRGSRSGSAGSPAAGVTSHRVNCFDRDLEAKIAHPDHRDAGRRRRRGSRVNLLQAIILGIVEGLTEFLPVSSTGHQTIVAGLMGLQIDDPSITSFIAVIQVGAIAALVIYLRKRHLAAVRWPGSRGLTSADARRATRATARPGW